eukprot:9289301-Pyramimonas_sp.AAC.1
MHDARFSNPPAPCPLLHSVLSSPCLRGCAKYTLQLGFPCIQMMGSCCYSDLANFLIPPSFSAA